MISSWTVDGIKLATATDQYVKALLVENIYFEGIGGYDINCVDEGVGYTINGTIKSTRHASTAGGIHLGDASKLTLEGCDGQSFSLALTANSSSTSKVWIKNCNQWTVDLNIGSVKVEQMPLLVDLATNQTSGTGEDTLITVNIPANTLGKGSGIYVRIAGSQTNGSSEAKTIKFYWGSDVYTVQNATTTANDWEVEVRIYVVGTGDQKLYIKALDAAPAVLLLDYDGAPNEDETGAITVKLTGEVGATGTDVIVARIAEIGYF